MDYYIALQAWKRELALTPFVYEGYRFFWVRTAAGLDHPGSAPVKLICAPHRILEKRLGLFHIMSHSGFFGGLRDVPTIRFAKLCTRGGLTPRRQSYIFTTAGDQSLVTDTPVVDPEGTLGIPLWDVERYSKALQSDGLAFVAICRAAGLGIPFQTSSGLYFIGARPERLAGFPRPRVALINGVPVVVAKTRAVTDVASDPSLLEITKTPSDATFYETLGENAPLIDRSIQRSQLAVLRHAPLITVFRCFEGSGILVSQELEHADSITH